MSTNKKQIPSGKIQIEGEASRSLAAYPLYRDKGLVEIFILTHKLIDHGPVVFGQAASEAAGGGLPVGTAVKAQ